MTANDLEELARQMVAGPAPKPYKKVFAWVGRPDSLRGVIPTRAMARKSLLDLCPASEIPSKEEAVPRWIERRLSACLDEVAAGSRYVLVLDDAEVLARYRVPLAVFHRFQGDRRAVVLVVAPGALPEHAGRLPSWTRFDPNHTVEYFQAALGEQCIVASDRRAHAEA